MLKTENVPRNGDRGSRQRAAGAGGSIAKQQPPVRATRAAAFYCMARRNNRNNMRAAASAVRVKNARKAYAARRYENKQNIGAARAASATPPQQCAKGGGRQVNRGRKAEAERHHWPGNRQGIKKGRKVCVQCVAVCMCHCRWGRQVCRQEVGRQVVAGMCITGGVTGGGRQGSVQCRHTGTRCRKKERKNGRRRKKKKGKRKGKAGRAKVAGSAGIKMQQERKGKHEITDASKTNSKAAKAPCAQVLLIICIYIYIIH